MRKARIKNEGEGWYHIVSRTAFQLFTRLSTICLSLYPHIHPAILYYDRLFNLSVAVEGSQS